MSFFDKVSAFPVSKEDLMSANAAVGSLSKADRGVEGNTFAMLQVFGGDVDPMKILAITFRLQAFSSLVSEGAVPGWAVNSGKGETSLVHAAAFEAAAQCPLTERNGKPAFDRTEFVQIALGAASPEGQS